MSVTLSPRQGRVVRIPANLKASLERDPIGFLRRMSATPVAAVFPFFTDRAAIHEAVNPDLPNPIDEKGRRFAPARVSVSAPNANRYAHIDLGVSGDAACICVCHSPRMFREKPYIVVDLLARFVPEKERPVLVDELERIIYAMTDYGYHIALVTADRFGSTQMLQHFEEKGYTCGHLSLDRTTTKLLVAHSLDKRIEKKSTEGDFAAPWLELKMAFADRRIMLPYYQPLYVQWEEGEEVVEVSKEALDRMNQTWIEKELSQLQGDAVKSVVVKLPGGTDDLAQVLAGAVFNLMNNEIDTGDAIVVEEKSRAQVEDYTPDSFYAEHYREEELDPRTASLDLLEKRLDRELEGMSSDEFYERKSE